MLRRVGKRVTHLLDKYEEDSVVAYLLKTEQAIREEALECQVRRYSAALGPLPGSSNDQAFRVVVGPHAHASPHPHLRRSRSP